MLRVVLGRARPEIEWTARSKFSDICFKPPPAVASMQSNGTTRVTGTIITIPRSHHELEIDLEAGSDTLDGREASVESTEKV